MLNGLSIIFFKKRTLTFEKRVMCDSRTKDCYEIKDFMLWGIDGGPSNALQCGRNYKSELLISSCVRLVPDFYHIPIILPLL